MTIDSVAESEARLAEPLSAEELEAIEVARFASRAPSTRRAYASAWSSWANWCAIEGREPGPAYDADLDRVHAAAGRTGADARHIAAYLSTQLATAGKSWRSHTVAAISAAHRLAGLDDPCESASVRSVLDGLVRLQAAQRAAQAHALSTEEVRQLVSARHAQTSRGRRDVAMLLTGYATALRASELTSLRREDVRAVPGGIEILVRTSKSDQHGAGRVAVLPYGSHPATDPVRALRAWIAVRDRVVGDTGPLFTTIRKGERIVDAALDRRSWDRILKSWCGQMLGIAVSTHSLRRGHVTTAVHAGASASAISTTTGQSLGTVGRYTAPRDRMATSTAHALGL